MTSSPPPGDPQRTEPVEYQRYGPARPDPQSASWQSRPWPQPPPAVAERRGVRLGLVPVLLIALIASVVSGGLSALAVTSFVRPPATAPQSQTDGTDATQASNVRIDESSAVISATEAVAPAVVTIQTQQGGLLGQTEGVGSGFIYHPDGWIVTNRHVVEDAESLTVRLPDSREFEGDVYGLDPLTDLAIVKVNARDLPTAPVGTSEDVKVGQLAIAIGSPLGNYENSVTSGVVSGLGRFIQAGDTSGTTSEQLNNLIQTDAAINRGNSGGPLVNSAGQVMGINTAVATSAQGIGFAIPIDIARPIMEQAVRGEELKRPWIGIYYVEITEPRREELNLPVSNGVLIRRPEGIDAPAVFPDSPAARAGLQEGDIIVALEDVQITAQRELSALVLRHEPGDTVRLRVVRGDTERDVRVTLGVMPDQE